jgi:hypothetical protein
VIKLISKFIVSGDPYFIPVSYSDALGSFNDYDLGNKNLLKR